MHAELQTLSGEVLDHGLEVGELRDERRPAIDHHEDIAERVDGGGVVRIFTHLPVSRHRPHAQLLEQGFPLA